MRQPPRTRAWVMVACAIGVGVSSARAQLVQPPPQPYAQTMQFGAGYINTPAAWVSQRSADSWLTISAKDIPSFDDIGGSEESPVATGSFSIELPHNRLAPGRTYFVYAVSGVSIGGPKPLAVVPHAELPRTR